MSQRKTIFLGLASALMLVTAAEETLADGCETRQIGPVVVTIVRGAERYLDFELVVPGTMAETWRTLMTSEGLAEWAGPAAYVEPHRDGAWDVYFKPEAPKGQRGSENRIIGIVPMSTIILEAGAPSQFPTVKAEKTITIFRLEPINAGYTRLNMTQTGWKQGEEWDRAFEYLIDGNAQWLGWLHRRFTEGPLQWEKILGGDG